MNGISFSWFAEKAIKIYGAAGVVISLFLQRADADIEYV